MISRRVANPRSSRLAIALLTVLLLAAPLAPAANTSVPAQLPGDEAPEASPVPIETTGFVRPGERVDPVDGSGWCTLNFVVTDGDDYWIGTAGHCFDENERVQVNDEPIGTVVAAEFAGFGAEDWAFVHVDEEHEDDVNPTVRSWGGPLAAPTLAGDATRQARPAPGDPVTHYGHGQEFDGDQAKSRAGVTVLPFVNSFVFVSDVDGGDSGSPVLTGQGQAVGIVTGHVATGDPVEQVYAYKFQPALFALESELGKDLSMVRGEPFLAHRVVDEDPTPERPLQPNSVPGLDAFETLPAPTPSRVPYPGSSSTTRT
jgi:hypothetical protein